MLLGTPDEIVDAPRAGNIADDPVRRFLVNPKDHIDARRAARSRGLSVVGFYHSHPRSEPDASPADREAASYPDHLYLIVRPRANTYEARLFRLEGSELVEEEFIVST
jgi:proteasome lid subunit RPN8/RPN11